MLGRLTLFEGKFPKKLPECAPEPGESAAPLLNVQGEARGKPSSNPGFVTRFALAGEATERPASAVRPKRILAKARLDRK